MNRTDLVLGALTRMARRTTYPEVPSAGYLRRHRWETAPHGLIRPLLGPVRNDVVTSDLEVPARDGVRLPVRLYRPRQRSGRLPLVLAFHGGGFVFGSFVENDWLCLQIAARVGAVVANVGYRLAPEHPAPGPSEDCWDLTCRLQRRAGAFGADPGRTSVVGTSAGGNLAALVAIAHRDRVREDPAVAPLHAQVLIYPATDLTLSSPSIDELGDAAFLSRTKIDWFGRQYVPQDRPDPVDPADPRVSPLLHPDHTDLAPALIMVAGRDPLRDDGVRYADALRAAGVPTDLVQYPDAVHGFISVPRVSPVAVAATDRVVDFLTR